jgi:high-affinity iron transporter
MSNPLATRRGLAAAAILTGLAVFLVFTALGVGDRAKPTGNAPVAEPAPFAIYAARTPHVLSKPAVVSAQAIVRGAPAAPPSELRPLPPSAFKRPVAEYRAYAGGRLAAMEKQLVTLASALTSNDRVAAQSAWRAAYASYLGLGAVYLTGEVSDLNDAIDGTPGGLPGGVSNPRFSGLHRIEYGLWSTTAQPRELLGWADRLETDVRKLRGTLPHVSVEPLEYATRAHEILEDAVRDLLSGADVPWSGEGVLATEAGLTATEEVIATLRPLLRGREDTLAVVEAELAPLRATLSSLAAAHGGRLPTNGQLTQSQAIRLHGTVGAALEALSLVPGTLETEAAPQVPSIPQRDVRIDP